MKRFLLLIIVFISIQEIVAQKNLNFDKPTFFEDVEIRPEFPGGYNELMKFIGKNFTLSEYEGNEGIIKMSFVIEIDGLVSSIEVIKDMGAGTGEEAKRVISLFPKWTPGEQGGKKVRVLYELPIKIVP